MNGMILDLSQRLAAIQAKTLFFVCSSPKSGSTWVQIMLDAHPRISCGGEGHFGDQLTPALQRALDDYNRYIGWKNGQKIGNLDGYFTLGNLELTYLVRTAVLMQLARQTEGRSPAAIGEKTPDNIGALPLLEFIFPEAKFIHVVRDGRDCCVSGLFHNERLTPQWIEQAFGTTEAYVAQFATNWARDQAAAARFAEKWPSRYMVVRYEDLVGDPTSGLIRMIDFLGVGHDGEILRECGSRGDFRRLSGGRGPGEEDHRSFFRKGVAGDWRNHLDTRLNDMFLEEAGAWLEHFGYARE